MIRALIESVPRFWHAEWRPNVSDRAIHATDGLVFVQKDEGNLVGLSNCAK